MYTTEIPLEDAFNNNNNNNNDIHYYATHDSYNMAEPTKQDILTAINQIATSVNSVTNKLEDQLDAITGKADAQIIQLSNNMSAFTAQSNELIEAVEKFKVTGTKEYEDLKNILSALGKQRVEA